MRVVECLIPCRAADALDLGTILRRAGAAGVAEPDLEAGPAKRGHERVHITCSVPMALFLVDEFRRLALASLPSADRTTRVDYGLAVAALLAGIDDARRDTPRRGLHAPDLATTRQRR